MKNCRILPQFDRAYQRRSTHFNIPLPRESPLILWLAARRQGRVVPTSTCDYAGCAKAGWRLRFCAVLPLPLVLNGVESINTFQHEI
jgi:hypothetical protein